MQEVNLHLPTELSNAIEDLCLMASREKLRPIMHLDMHCNESSMR